MSQAKRADDIYDSIPMPRLATGSLTPEQRDLALQRLQDQTDQRTRLGFELFRATEAQTTRQQAAIDLLQTQHNELSTRLEVEVNALRQRVELHEADMLRRLSETADQMQRKVDAIQQNWSGVERRMAELVNRITHLAEGVNRQLVRPSPRPEVPTEKNQTRVMDDGIPMTAASSPGPIDARLRAEPGGQGEGPSATVSRPPAPAQEDYEQALRRLRSERARPTEY